MIRTIAVVVFSTFFVYAMRLGAAARLTNALPVNGAVVISWDSRGALEMGRSNLRALDHDNQRPESLHERPL